MAESSLRGVRAAAGSSSAEALLCIHQRPDVEVLLLLLFSIREHTIGLLHLSGQLAFSIGPRNEFAVATSAARLLIGGAC